MERICLRLMFEQDLAMLHEWLNRPHVLEWWGGQRPTLGMVREKYEPRIMAEEQVTPYIALLDDKPFAFAQTYVVTGSGGGWWAGETDPGARGIDQFIADPNLLGKGFGTALVSAMADLLFADPSVSRIQADPAPSNTRAIHVYEKAGFRRAGVIETPDGHAILMLKERPALP
jgi:AacA4 family aminoglycoside N(6')-acetyltransferase